MCSTTPEAGSLCRHISQLFGAGVGELDRVASAVAVGAGTCHLLPAFIPPHSHPPFTPPCLCLLCLQLAEQTERGASKSSYLCKYRAHATASLWAPTWELR